MAIAGAAFFPMLINTIAGVRLALNISLSISIAVELVIAKKGIGAMIWFA